MSSMTCRIRQRIGCWSGWGASRRLDGGPDVFRLSIRSLLAHKLRMAMSVAAVVLGVAFVPGPLVFAAPRPAALDEVVSGGASDVSVVPRSAVDGSAPAADAVLTVPD